MNIVSGQRSLRSPEGFSGLSCAYCGSRAESRDHVIPVAISHIHGAPRFRKGDWLVPACLECNVHLQALPLLTLPDRAAFLFGKFSWKWRKTLRAPSWTEAEIEELRGALKIRVIAMEAEKKRLESRLEHLQWVASQDAEYLMPQEEL